VTHVHVDDLTHGENELHIQKRVQVINDLIKYNNYLY